MGALTGVKVLDLSRMLPGPLCTWYLSGMGALIDRIETPGSGDYTRHMPPFQDGVGVFFAALNRGDRSCILNLRKPEGVQAFRQLLGRYDVLVEGFRPGVMEKLGLVPDELVSAFPQLVVARITGFGQTGPWAFRPGHDINYVGLAGLPGWNDNGVLPPAQIADTSGALVAAMGICGALYQREKTGRGQVLDVSLTEAALGVVGPHVSTLTAENRNAKPDGELLSGMLPTYGVYQCMDGGWLTVGALEPKFQAALQATVGGISRPELSAVFRTKSRDEWVAILDGACVGPSLGVSELADHPQHMARGALMRCGHTSFVVPPFSDDHWKAGAVPKAGQHSREILREAGCSIREVNQWLECGAVEINE